MSEDSGYLAYMLRLRRVLRDGQPVWQASVESPHTGERHAFASPEALFAFLRLAMQASQAGEAWEAGTQPDGPEAERKHAT